MAFTVRELLTTLGFQEAWDVMADQLPGYKYAVSGITLTAAQVTNKYFQPCFLILGHAQCPRTLTEIHFEMPLDVDSYEQGLAWLVYGIGRNLSWASAPRWFDEGRLLQEHLPWQRRRSAYETRPRCTVDRDWFKLAAKKLRGQASTAARDERAIFRFDGTVLRVDSGSLTVAMPATGDAWQESFAIPAIHLDHLPQRYADAMVHVSVFDGRLSIANRAWELVSAGHPDDQPDT